MNTEAFLFGALIMAGLTAWLATYKGRSPIVWGVVGFAFGLLSLIVLACLPNLRKRATLP